MSSDFFETGLKLMPLKNLFLSGLIIFSALLFWGTMIPNSRAQSTAPDYKNANLPVEQRVNDLLARMTLAEKVAQLQCRIHEVENTDLIQADGIGGLGCQLRTAATPQAAAEKLNRLQKFMLEKTRLGIPVIMHDEALHGLVGPGATSFPQAIGLASTWDPNLMARVAQVIARETKSRGIRQVLSPVVNIARDVRWGRVEETYGEDPYLTARMGVAFCKSFEKSGVMTTPKHYAANVGDGGRDSNPIHFTERLMREIYFPAFKACFQEAGATSVMAAYNAYDGIPCSSNRWLLTEVLRNEWNFQGFVVSDYGSIGGIFDLHKTAANAKETAKQAIEAGMDVELPTVYYYGAPLLQAVEEGLVAEAVLDQAVRRVLTMKFKLGLFENPFVVPEEAARVNDHTEHRALALEAARASLVLLKNENQTLPLKKSVKSVAVIGPMADVVKLGGYSGWGIKTVSALAGIRNKMAAGGTVTFAKGCELEQASLPPIPAEYLRPPTGKKGELGLQGEYFSNKDLAGMSTLVRIDKQLHFDWAEGSPDPQLKPDQFSVRWTGKLIAPFSGPCQLGMSTDDGVRFYLDGQLLIDRWVDRGTTTDIATVNLKQGQAYDLRIEYYENMGYAFASLGWDFAPKKTDQFAEAVALAKKSEVVVIVTGILEGEGRDRANLDLPEKQEKLIQAIARTGKPTVVVLTGGSAITMQRWLGMVPAVFTAWYPGEEGGHALADVLFGDYNPAGRLPITFPQSVAQTPLYYNTKPTGRGYDYVDLSGKPQFPFGHGLSYTKFDYSNLRLNPDPLKAGNNLKIMVTVQNIGAYAGDEVVQLYLHDVIGSVTRPLKELKGFQRIHLAPNEKQIVMFDLTPAELGMYDRELKWVVEPGIFEIMIGGSSEDVQIRTSFEVIP
ncbi:glycoside hydrolase family 3 C-terminal domain-containing protein [candidate division KSB1 bacterium]|nr:glycoside hydrolase family 3 C-terminal domain-containing protein [candidate division KSB1 bacterium]